jgi:hypothetical protein
MEYKLISWAPGSPATPTDLLNRYAAEGWRVTSHAVTGSGSIYTFVLERRHDV